MSYCRWSYGSDVYCYESFNGFETHVASRRHVSLQPFPELERDWFHRPAEEVAARLQAQAAWYQGATTVPIGLDHDGASYTDDDAEGCAERLKWLRAQGYQVPQYAIEVLLEEAREAAAG